MRIWSIHPKYLDAKGLVALWRETLLAQNVLAGNTKGYRNHPQLTRFKGKANPLSAIGSYLRGVHNESIVRNYKFDQSKILTPKGRQTLPVNDKQIEYEQEHLLRKLKYRNPPLYKKWKSISNFDVHPMFKKIKGPIEEWEII